MPMSSLEIAQMNGAYQGAAMNQQHYAGMVGQQQWQPSTANPSQIDYGSKATSRAAGFASSVAMPAMALGAGAMGLDPFSMAISGGQMGMRMGGMGGMVGGAALGAGTALGAAAITGYAVNQGFQGIQQQQQLQQQLGQSFQFKNQFGGRGFTAGGMQNIGNMMRGMTTQQGAFGEMTSFEELGRLAQNMARMGMDQGVRNAKDFSDKFRQMVKTLKDVATTMGTSLEEAQKMMSGMKSSGVFKAGDQLRAFRMIKAGTDTGVLSADEMTGAGSIGSQISRSIGGTGKAGMTAGMRTLANIGAMQQMGLLTEEQIFNATGLEGAEGRQALMTQQVSSSARFLKTTKGRFLTASLAGKDGKLDQGDLQAYLHGSVSVGDTRKRAYENLHGVGRANFIRNEGRLGGEILAAFGGNTDAMALMGWMGQRGLNVNTNSDRAMLYLQRTLKLGRDEADVVVEKVRNLPQILKQQEANKDEGKFGASLRLVEAHRGIENIKHKFAKAKADAGASIEREATDLVSAIGQKADQVLGDLFGVKASFYQANTLAVGDLAARGGATGRAMGRSKFGFNPVPDAGMGGFSARLRDAAFSTPLGFASLPGLPTDPKSFDPRQLFQNTKAANYAQNSLLTSSYTTTDDALEGMGRVLSGRGPDGAENRTPENQKKFDDAALARVGSRMPKSLEIGNPRGRGWETGTEAWVRTHGRRAQANLDRATSDFWLTDAGKSITGGVFGDADQRAEASKEITRRLDVIAKSKSENKGDLDVAQRGEKTVLETAGAALALRKLGDKATDADYVSIAKKFGMGGDTKKLVAAVGGMLRGEKERQIASTRQYAAQAGERAEERIKELGDDLGKLENGVGGEYVKKRMEAEKLRIAAGKSENDTDKSDLLRKANAAEEESYNIMSGMTGEQRQKFTEESGGMGGAGFLTAAVYEVQGLAKGLSARGAGPNMRQNFIAEQLGIKLTKEEKKQMQGMSSEKAAIFLKNKSDGLIDEKTVLDLQNTLDEARKGGVGTDQGKTANSLARTLGGVSQEKLERAKKERDPSYEINQEILTTLKNAFGPTGTASRSLTIIANNTAGDEGTKDAEAVNPPPPPPKD